MPGNARNRPEPRVVVYRVVDQVELSYLRRHGDYGTNPSRSGKYFALTIAGVRAFASAPMNRDTTITSTTLPQSVLDRGVKLHDPGPQGAGLSVFFSQQQLAEVYDTMAMPAIVEGH